MKGSKNVKKKRISMKNRNPFGKDDLTERQLNTERISSPSLPMGSSAATQQKYKGKIKTRVMALTKLPDKMSPPKSPKFKSTLDQQRSKLQRQSLIKMTGKPEM